MGKAKEPRRVKLVIGMLAKNEKLFDMVEEFFIRYFGKIDCRSNLILFDHTSYYEEELGLPLKRKFISFRTHISPEKIARIKIITNSIEKRFSRRESSETKRDINIDPGYVSDSKFILATTKDYFHRIYLSKGIYAEVTLTWKKGTFHGFEWTYPDYKTKVYIDILNSIRNLYMKERTQNVSR